METITLINICVNYSDFLEITLPINKKHFDEIIIVTRPEDLDTIEICNKEGIKIITTDCFDYYQDGFNNLHYKTFNGQKIFNKSAAFNLAIEFSAKEWICLNDADIILDSNFRQEFFKNAIDKEFLYGSRRTNLDTRQDFINYINNPKIINEYLTYRGVGYGFNQIFHYKSKICQDLIKKYGHIYPINYNGSESDWWFRKCFGEFIYDPPGGEFPELHRRKNNDRCTGNLKELPFNCIHLGQAGKNCCERITEKF